MRTIDVDEMLGTLAMASCAAFVRSGIPATAEATFRPDGAAGFDCPAAAGASAAASSAERMRPVRTNPATNPMTTKTVARARRLNIDGRSWRTTGPESCALAAVEPSAA